MGRYRFNPFTGTLDDVGSGSGGGGTVTSVAGGVGITGTPDPIVGAGTLDLDLFSLTTGADPLAAGDWLAFVDVSEGTGPADQRKVTFADLVAAVNPLLDHGLLTGLGDDDHAQYLLLLGRAGGQVEIGGTGAGDDLTAQSTSHATKGHLIWDDAQDWWPSIPDPDAVNLGWTIAKFDPAITDNTAASTKQFLLFDPDFTTAATTPIGGSSNGVFAYGVAGSWTNASDLENNDIYSAVRLTSTFDSAFDSFPGPKLRRLMWDRTVTTATAGDLTASSVLQAHQGLFFEPRFIADGAGAELGINTLLVAVSCQPVLSALNGGLITGREDVAGTISGLRMEVPAITETGGGTVDLGVIVGVNCADYGALATLPLSLRSVGFGVQMRHAGPGVFGSATVAPVGMFDVHGDITLQPAPGASRLFFYEPAASGTHSTRIEAQAQAADISWTLPAAQGAANTSLTNDGSGTLSWVAHQPLDADLTAIAAIGVSQGSLIIGDSSPAWVELVIGAADKYLRSNGTTAAWADVTELGLVDTYNGIATVSVGMPSLVAQVNLTAQAADIGTTTLYTPPSAGLYRFAMMAAVTQVATVSSTRPSLVIGYTHGDNATAQTAAPIPTNAGNSLTTVVQNSFVIYAASGVAITYATTGYASSGATPMQYSLRIRLEAL